jgi:hypothetical protein
MPPKMRLETGSALEARVQRLFMCQGAYAERDLFMRAGPGESKMVTDIDVVAHEYSVNFQHRRTYAECKGGKNKSALDRVIWIRGVKEVIAADNAYLVLDHCDPSTVRFARSQSIDILQASSLETLEEALRISPDFWPGRCNLRSYSTIGTYFKKLPARPAPESVESWLKRAQEVWLESSALTFTYGRLNALLGMLKECEDLPVDPAFRPHDSTAVVYAASALLVRLSQYVLFIASDTLAMTQAERVEYLSDRLVSGSLDIGQSRQILRSALHMVNAQLSVAGLQAPASWNIDSMLTPPSYTRPLATVVDRVIRDGHKSAMLPLAMELRMFGYIGEEQAGGTLLSRARYAFETAGLVIAFARQSLGVPELLTSGVASVVDEISLLKSKSSTPATIAVTDTADKVAQNSNEQKEESSSLSITSEGQKITEQAKIITELVETPREKPMP